MTINIFHFPQSRLAETSFHFKRRLAETSFHFKRRRPKRRNQFLIEDDLVICETLKLFFFVG